ncbi:MAG: DUF1156 domain-containing protein [Candidatus Hydrogenedentales bacterium]
MDYKKKLIEVALPLEAINAAAAREKSIRHGHPSTLHLWWARRPLAAARAVIWASLVDDPSSHPDAFPTEEAQTKERERLFHILERLVIWENSNNKKVLAEAKAEIMKATGGNPPPLLDPFAGGGAIPLEAQRLGLEAHAGDLNPVAVMINKAMIEIPPTFAGQPPVNPEAKKQIKAAWPGTAGLADDVRYYGDWMKREAIKEIGHLYPKIKDEEGIERTVIAWLWTRTVTCPNPACRCVMPLASTFVLSKKKGSEAYIEPIIEGTKIRYEIRYGKKAPKPPKMGRGANFNCLFCSSPVDGAYIKAEGLAKRIGSDLMAIVAEGERGRMYISPDNGQVELAASAQPDWIPEGDLFGKATDQLPAYGYRSFSDLFTKRQLAALTTFSDLVPKAQKQIEKDGGKKEYAQSVCVYLAFIISKLADMGSTVCSWNIARAVLGHTFSRQALPMVWDFAEANPFSNSTGSYENALTWISKVIVNLPVAKKAYVTQQAAQTNNRLTNIIVSTDPPYYDNICYADLSDFFYIWLRRILRDSYPDLFRTMRVPKAEELVASVYRFKGDKEEATRFFEEGMVQTFRQINSYVSDDIPTTVYYGYKQSETDDKKNKASTGWETILSAIIQAGFTITGTWPMRTEMMARSIARATNALASSIVLVCRKRPAHAPMSTRRDFINVLRRELKPALKKLEASRIAPVDLAQSAIGPGMAVYSRFSKVVEADGSTMSVRSALELINQELDLFFSDQEGDLDNESRFCVDLYRQYAFNSIQYGVAEVLARAKNTSVEKLAKRGILFAEKGIVRLSTREELPEKIDKDKCTWLLTQQLTHVFEMKGFQGAAKIVTAFLSSEPEQARALAYRLFQLADRKKWAQEALVYNNLIAAWSEIQNHAAVLASVGSDTEQLAFFDNE